VFVLLHHLHRVRHGIGLSSPHVRGSLALRHVDAGSCNACEHELTATTGPHYDLQQYGLQIVASPRHADVLLVTGLVTAQMAAVLRTAYDAMPEPRLVAALGDCALGCGVLGLATELAGPVDAILPVAARIEGCPPSPERIAETLLALIDDAAPARPGDRDVNEHRRVGFRA
jgi:Ni,Fe-hydrogenase III small subunit